MTGRSKDGWILSIIPEAWSYKQLLTDLVNHYLSEHKESEATEWPNNDEEKSSIIFSSEKKDARRRCIISYHVSEHKKKKNSLDMFDQEIRKK